MKVFTELTIIPNAEISPYFIWSKLYIQLHLAMVEIQDSNKQVPVGVSFPEYKVVENENKKFAMLGSKLRLFAKYETILKQLDLIKWLERLTDYVHIRNVDNVPQKADSYLVVSRSPSPSNSEFLARRYAIRHNTTYEEALKRLEGYEQKFKVLPYIHLKSLSKGHNFNLFISQKLVNKEKAGTFSTYGLSSESTVPHW